MLPEVLDYLNLKKGDKVIDCTLGGGGYAGAILKLIGEKGELIAIDRDSLAIDNARCKFKDFKNLKIAKGRFSDIDTIAHDFWGRNPKAHAVVMDLGLSSAQISDEQRGFSFMRDSDLKMEMSGTDSDIRTVDIVNKWKESELEKIIKTYGEEKYAKSIARNIVLERKKTAINKTGQLLEIIATSVPAVYRNSKKIHFATRTFQALRIATNRELEDLETVLPKALSILLSGGRLATVSFHSLEDRIVKRYFKKESINCHCPPEAPLCMCNHEKQIKIITKKPVTASREEILKNPRSRSAKLRIAQKI